MKSYHANAGSGLAGLMLNEDPEPEPGPHEVLVRVRANSLLFRELSILDGTYPLPVKPDVVMGADGAGEIVALGADASRVAIGDRSPPRCSRDGSMARSNGNTCLRSVVHSTAC